MRFRSLLAAGAIGALSLSGVAFAQPNTDRVPAENTKSGVSVTIPEHAVEVAPGIFSLGSATDVDGRAVEGYMLFHHKEGHDGGPGGGGGNDSGGTTCFELLSKGAKWRTAEPWLFNTANNEGLSGSYLLSNQSGNLQKFEDASGSEIFGDGSETTETLVADTESPDDQNEVLFGSIDDAGAIAVTIVWGTFRGPPHQRELVEWDQVYDQVDFDWSDSGEAGKMDFENIATHEDGHAAGLGHPSDDCTEETMYRFAEEGETKKRDLHTGDVSGINELY